MRLSYRPERVRGALLGVAIVLTGLSIVAQLLTGPTGAALDSDYYGLSLLFNSAAEPSVANLYSALLLVVCAVMAGLCASAKRERGEPYALHWAGLALVFAFMALDEGASLHEASIPPLRSALDAHGLLFNAWVVPWGIAILGLVVYARFFRDLPRRIRSPLTLAAIAFVAASLGLEMVEGLLIDTYENTGLPFAIAITVEELVEMCALAVFVYALLIELAASVGSVRLEPAVATRLSDPE